MRFVVRNRQIQYIYENISIGDNADYVATFDLDDEWDGFTVTARFINGDKMVELVLEDRTCIVPVEMMKKGKLMVGVYTAEMTTTPCEVWIAESIKQYGGTTPAPSEDVYAQILSKVDRCEEVANDLEEKAESGYFDGVSPTATVKKVGKVSIITITDVNGTTTATIKDGEGSEGGEANVIESISVNGTPISPDDNKNVDITVPSIDGLTKDADLAKVAKSGSYDDLSNKPIIPSLDGYAKTSEIPTKVSELENDSNYLSSIPEDYVTETELSAKGYLTEHQDLSAYAKKEEIPTVPSKVSELTNDSNYQTAKQVNSTVTTEIAKVVADAPEDLNTLKEMSDWIAGHEDDASAMNSAISDNKTAITALQTNKANKSDIPTTVAELTDSADYAKTADIPTSLPANGGNSDTVNNHTVETDVPTDAVFTDTIYDDTEVKESIAELNSNLDCLSYDENSGGDNIFDYEKFINRMVAVGGIKNGKEISFTHNEVDPPVKMIYTYEPNTQYTLILKGKSSYSTNSNVRIKYTDNTATYITFSSKDTIETIIVTSINGKTISSIECYYGDKTIVTLLYKECGIFKGVKTLSDFKSFIPSLKMLADEVNQQKNDLDGLGYGENQGGSNIAWISKERVISDIGVQVTYFDGGVSISQNETYSNLQIKVPCKRNTKYNYGLKGYSDGNLKQFTIGSGIVYNWDNIIKYYVFNETETSYSGSFTTGDYDFLTVTLYASNNIARGSMTIKDFYISETDMSYEPYIPSVKMLAEENAQQSIKMLDAKMLGWTVPKECPIQNYTDSDGVFHQRVGRVDLGSTSIIRFENYGFRVELPATTKVIGVDVKANFFCNSYAISTQKTYSNYDKTICYYSTDSSEALSYIIIRDTNYNDLESFKNAVQGVYLYYELAEGISMNVDGNEVAERLKNDLSKFTSGQYIDGSTDWNTIKTSGMYYYNGWGSSGGSNKPTETKTIGMAFILNTGNTLLQFAVLASGNSYFRNGTVDEPGSWITIS